MNTATIAVGDDITPFTRTTGLANWNRFAAVNHEFVDIHMDDEAGRAAGFDGALGMGNLMWSYLHCLVRDWAGPSGRITAMSCQFRRPNLKGATVTARGVVSAVRVVAGGREVDLDIRTEDESGNILTPGTATVVFDA